MDVRAIDVNAVWWGHPLEILMENAGKAIAKHCQNHKKIAVICGRGNNGGDGLVAARLLSNDGIHTKAYVLEGERSKLNELNLKLLEDKDIIMFSKAKELKLTEYDLIIDALIGEGFKGKLKEPMKSIIDEINKFDAEKISIDSPSAGEIEADSVISLHISKIPGAIVEDIGIPTEAMIYCGPGDVQVAIPKRIADSHKGDYGKVAIIAGSIDYIGAPMLAADAALRSGADLVTLYTPKKVAAKIEYNPNLIVRELESEEYITEKDVEKVLELDYDAILFGNGVGRKSKDAVKKLLMSKKPVVLDADGISMCKKEWLHENMIVTPHAKEYEKLYGMKPDKDNVLENAKKYKAIILSKGVIDYISDGVEIRENKSGNPHMTVGGTGDVLAGLTVGLLAQNHDMQKSATAAAFLTGVTGDMSATEFGVSMNASDMIEYISYGIQACQQITEE